MTRRVCAVWLGLGGVAALSILTVARASPPQVLFVTGSTMLGLGDTAIKARLEATGHSVEVCPGATGILPR